MFRFNALRNVAKNIRPRYGSHSGHSHGSHAQSAEPYAVKHHATQPSEAYPFGRIPGTPLEGWEIITAVTVFACTALLTTNIYFSHDENFQMWAKREALAREKIIENGGEIEFGKYYSDSTNFVSEEVDKMP
eukprot:gene12783-26954_t